MVSLWKVGLELWGVGEGQGVEQRFDLEIMVSWIECCCLIMVSLIDEFGFIMESWIEIIAFIMES